MADLAGVKLTTQALRSITGDIQDISKDIDDIMSSFQSTMGKISGDAEGGIVEQITDTGKDLFDGVTTLAKCIMKIGLGIGDYLTMLLNHDSDMAQTLRQRIESD